MTAADIERAIMRELWLRSTILPRWTPPGWFECDVAEITRNGYLVEYEIKLSRADFRADASKRPNDLRWRGAWLDVPERQPTKHARLAAADPAGPSRFWFVAPRGLLSSADVPAWAGLIEAFPTKGGYRSITLKPAPRLHLVKTASDLRPLIHTAAYYRWHRQTAAEYGQHHSDWSI